MGKSKELLQEAQEQPVVNVLEKSDCGLLIAALIKAKNEADKIEKDMTVGSGGYSYKGVSEKIVKKATKTALINNGLTIVPIDIQEETIVDRWEEKGYRKQSVFTKVKIVYRIYHVSGQSITAMSIGHGVDAQDKGAGKCTTYAYKILLINLFDLYSGDDTDNTHSKDYPVPTTPKTTVPKKYKLPDAKFEDLKALSIQELTTTYNNYIAGKFNFVLTAEQEAEIKNKLNLK